MVGENRVEFLGCEFDCLSENIKGSVAAGDAVEVEVDFEKVNLEDNASADMIEGEVKFILYKGNHYHLTVHSDWDEDVFVDTNDVWDNGDRVGITIPAEAIRVMPVKADGNVN